MTDSKKTTVADLAFEVDRKLGLLADDIYRHDRRIDERLEAIRKAFDGNVCGRKGHAYHITSIRKPLMPEMPYYLDVRRECTRCGDGHAKSFDVRWWMGKRRKLLAFLRGE